MTQLRKAALTECLRCACTSCLEMIEGRQGDQSYCRRTEHNFMIDLKSRNVIRKIATILKEQFGQQEGRPHGHHAGKFVCCLSTIL